MAPRHARLRERRALADSGYNKRRAECAQACELLGVDSLRQVDAEDSDRDDLDRLPEAIARRVRHVLDENARVLATVAALREGDFAGGALLDASHASLRDLYECSTPAVEATVEHQGGRCCRRTYGRRGFGGTCSTLSSRRHPTCRNPRGQPSRGAHLLWSCASL